MSIIKCSCCKCPKLESFFGIKTRTGLRFKTCKQCRDKHKCSQCEFASSRESHLTRHIKQVHSKIKDFKCSQCEYACSTNSNLTTHVKMVHSKIKDFKCSQCEYACSANCNLTTHIKQVHSKIKDFKCSQCEYASSRNVDLTIHIKRCTGSLNISSGELAVRNALDSLNMTYNSEVAKVKNGKGNWLRFDFEVMTADEPIYIEYDGKQHTEPQRFGGMTPEKAQLALKKTQRHDRLKNEWCDDNGFLLLRIPYTQFDNISDVISEFMAENTA